MKEEEKQYKSEINNQKESINSLKQEIEALRIKVKKKEIYGDLATINLLNRIALIYYIMAILFFFYSIKAPYKPTEPHIRHIKPL